MKKLILALSSALFLFANSYAQSNRMQSQFTVDIVEWCSSWCASNSGTLVATPMGGSGPYSYYWNGMPGSDTLIGVPPGLYDLIVVDAVGDSAFGTGNVEYQADVPFYVISIAMASQGLNNGAFEVAMYPSGQAYNFPLGTYNYVLFDSTGFNTLETNTLSYYGGPGPDAFYVFDSLPAGKYYVQGTSPFGCFTQVEFRIKELPSVIPTFSVSDACNGSPTGTLNINLHPSPSLNATTFTSNLVASNGATGDHITSQYKITVLDSAGNSAEYFATQDSVLTFSDLLPGNYTLQVFTGDTLYASYIPNIQDSILVFSSSFTITNDPNCSLVKGRVFGDYNNNCSYGFGDVLFPGTLVELNPGGYSYVTNAAGEFFIPVVNGTYTLKQYAPYQFAQVCPDTNTFTINIPAPGIVVDVQLADSVNVNPNVQVGLFANAARPGFDQAYSVHFKNLTPNIIPAQTVTLNYDNSLNPVGTNPASTTSTLGQVTWAGVSLPPFGEIYLNLTVNIPAATPLGTILGAAANVTAVTGETILSNNSDSIAVTVTGSFDPNDKEVSPRGFDADGYITNSQNLKYTIRFQNTGTATAFAVTVIDSLPLALNKYSLSVLGSSHPYSYEFTAGNVVKFHFNNILLPDSNSNEAGSHGYIKFSIDQLPGNLPATTIENNAGIYFDFNAPIITNTVKNTIFDCNQMASVVISNTSICERDSVTLTGSTLFNMDMEWLLNASQSSTGGSVTYSNLPAGLNTIAFSAINPVCNQIIVSTVIVNTLPPQPTISQTLNVLTSSAPSGNQWMLSGNPISGATSSDYTVTQNGWYSVMVTDGNNCGNISDSVFITVTGVKEFQKNTILLSPNPVKNELNITGLTKGTHEIIITDVLCHEIMRTTISNFELKLNTPFSKGIYFVTIKKDSHNEAVLKMVKE